MRLTLLVIAALACACTPPRTSAAPASASDLLERARELHRSMITVDTHDDIPLNFATPEVDPLNADRQVNLEKMRAGGLDAGFFIVYVGQTPRTAENYEQARADAMRKFAAIHRMADTLYPHLIELAYSPADVRRINRSGKLVAAIGIENGYVIGRDLSLIAPYFALGARYMTLAHGRNNDICDSSTDPAPEHNGLSAFGRDAVREMNRVGMMVDISHVSKQCMLQATALSTSPVIASHSSTKALADVPRNMDDEQLRAVAANGGVAHMVALVRFVKTTPPRATVADFVDHIDHAVRVAGINHVGISSDFDGGGGVVGWEDASQTWNVTVELLRRGYSDDEIRKLWGENLLRVWEENRRRATAR
ncbi:MAG: dipeptidase [Gemmatimonadaceae bacterium]